MFALRSKITQAVLNYFLLQDSKESYVNELARRLSLDSGNLTRKLIELENAGILKSRWQGTERYYLLNKDFPLLKEYKNIIVKTVGFESLLKEALKEVGGVKSAVIFGSYAKDKMDALSDIDLLVIGKHNAVDLQRTIAKVQNTLDRDINAISMTESEYQAKKKAKDPLVMSIDAKPRVVVL